MHIRRAKCHTGPVTFDWVGLQKVVYLFQANFLHLWLSLIRVEMLFDTGFVYLSEGKNLESMHMCTTESIPAPVYLGRNNPL